MKQIFFITAVILSGASLARAEEGGSGDLPGRMVAFESAPAPSDSARPLARIINGLSPAQKLVFYESIRLNEKGEITTVYLKDVATVLGRKAVAEVLRKLGMTKALPDGSQVKSGEKHDDDDDDDDDVDSLKDYWCVSSGNCGKSPPGYYCNTKTC